MNELYCNKLVSSYEGTHPKKNPLQRNSKRKYVVLPMSNRLEARFTHIELL